MWGRSAERPRSQAVWEIGPYEVPYMNCREQDAKVRPRGLVRAERVAEDYWGGFVEDLRGIEAKLAERGAFPSACLEDVGAPPEASDTPGNFFGWADAESFKAKEAGEPKPWRMDLADAYERCTKDYYEQLRGILEQRKEDLLETERENIEELQELRDELVAAEEGPTGASASAR